MKVYIRLHGHLVPQTSLLTYIVYLRFKDFKSMKLVSFFSNTGGKVYDQPVGIRSLVCIFVAGSD